MTDTSVADQEVSRFMVSTACVVYLFGYAGYCFSETLGIIRYLVYAVPPILVASLILQRAPKINNFARSYFLAYLSLGYVTYLIGIKNTAFFLNDFIIIVLVIVGFVPVISVSFDHIRNVFFCSVAYFALAYALEGHGGVRLFQILESGTGSGLEDGFDNHQGGLVGPVYAVFFGAIGAKVPFILALVMSVLGGKRIGIVAILVGLIAFWLFRRVTALQERRVRFIVLLAGLTAINLTASNLVSIFEYLHHNLETSVSIEEIMLGRYAIGAEMTHVIENRSLMQSLVGFGPGSANALATLISGGGLGEPHNDWLKILYDYGMLGSILITVFLALVFSSSRIAAVIALTSATIMATNNVAIYLYYQIPIVLMVAYSAKRASGTAELDNAPAARPIEV